MSLLAKKFMLTVQSLRGLYNLYSCPQWTRAYVDAQNRQEAQLSLTNRARRISETRNVFFQSNCRPISVERSWTLVPHCICPIQTSINDHWKWSKFQPPKTRIAWFNKSFVVYPLNNYQNSDWFYFLFIFNSFCICNSAVFYCTVFYIHIYFTVSVQIVICMFGFRAASFNKFELS